MRIVVFNPNQPQPDLLARAAQAKDQSAAVLQLRALNPQLDFSRLAAGDVVVLPGNSTTASGTGAAAAAGSSPGAQALADIQNTATAALKAAVAAMRQANADRAADTAAVAAAIANESVKAALERDPVLKADLDAAVKAGQAEDKAAAADADLLAVIGKALPAEFEAMGRLLG